MSQLVKITFLSLSLFLFQNANAAIWHYSDYQSNLDTHHKNWIVAQFNNDPYPTDWEELSNLNFFDRASLIFSTPASETLSSALAPLVTEWQNKNIAVTLKFLNSYPTDPEAQRLLSVCNSSLNLEFLASNIPTQYESSNLQKLAACAHVHIAMGRYPRYLEKDFFTPIKNLPLTISTDYYPPYAAADTLNIIGMPVTLSISDMMPSQEGIQNLNYIEKLEKLSLSFTAPLEESDFALLRGLKSEIAKTITWTHSQITRHQLDRLKSLGLAKLILNSSTLSYSGVRDSELLSVADEVVIINDQE